MYTISEIGFTCMYDRDHVDLSGIDIAALSLCAGCLLLNMVLPGKSLRLVISLIDMP